jgi:RimJ/RimL family protein N-acetyltransferase
MTGYVLAADSWGQGYASESLEAMVVVAAQAGVRELSALCHTEHGASIRVLEKGGFVKDAFTQQPIVFPNLGDDVPQAVWRYVRHLSPQVSIR